MSQQKQSGVTTTKESSIITMTANKIFENLIENIVLFFMAVFVSLCGLNGLSSSNSSNSKVDGRTPSGTSSGMQIHHLIFLPQQRKSLFYNIVKNHSSKQDPSQSLGISNRKQQTHHKHHRKVSSINY
ncbi:14422_t:CDS:1 [Funneliformis caledonium]|uniref:14422_t:CDS:1 n=2 Tax=Funneliformis TaxID=1117308 RepID=A0A9N8VPR4_9GLOM|nr:14422_t:CDS:1 [Funneliformis caledonium]CAG8490228.1 1341_t:CDS:1 [Funneliformis mosseae]